MATEHTHSNSSGCCGNANEHEHVDEFAHDPTLASCCERDQQDFKRAMALKRLLTAHDPTSGGVRLRQQLFEPTAAAIGLASMNQALPQQQQQPPTQVFTPLQLDKQRCTNSDDSDDSDSDFELDDALDHVYIARRKALEAQLQLAQRNAIDGFGIVVERDWQSLLSDARTAPNVPFVVFVTSSSCLVSAPASERMLVQAMQSVAATFSGSKFAVVSVRSTSTDTKTAMREFGIKTAPSVVAIRSGEIVDAFALDTKLGHDDAATFWEAQLVPWLNMCSVLATTRSVVLNAAAGTDTDTREKRRGDTDNDSDCEPPANDCGVENCRIRYGFAHEHVGASQDARREVAAWRS